MRKCAFLFVSVLLLTDGCGGTDKPRFSKEELARMPFPQRSGLPECSGGFVLSVGGKTITSDEIVGSVIERNGVYVSLIESLRPIAQKNGSDQFKEQAQARVQVEHVLNSKLSRILLYQRAKRQAGEGVDEALERLAEAEVKKFFAIFEGDDAKADEALKQMGMNRQSYKEFLKMTILNQSYMASKIPDNRPITYSELLECYNEMKDEFAQPAVIKFRLIDIKVAELEVSDPNQDLGPEDRRQLARDLANELVGRTRAGEDIGELYEKYPRVSFVDHSGGVQPKNLGEPYDILVAVAEKIEPGQVPEPIETRTGEHIFIMKFDGEQPKSFKPLRDVQREVKKKIISDRQQKAMDELEAELLRQAPLGEKDAFVDFCLEKIYRMVKQEKTKD